jgi:hypothetical protein
MEKRLDSLWACWILGVGAILLTFLLLLWQSSSRSYPETENNPLVNEHLSQKQLTLIDNSVAGADGLIIVGMVFAHNGRYQAAEYRLRLAADILDSAKAALILAEFQHQGLVPGRNVGSARYWAEKAVKLNRFSADPAIASGISRFFEAIRAEDGKEKNN